MPHSWPQGPANHLSCASKKPSLLPNSSSSQQASTSMKTKSSFLILFSLLLFLLAAPFLAADPDTLQDLCVADLSSAVTVNGFVCKTNVTQDDFFFQGLAKPGNTSNPIGLAASGATVESVPGLNTLGVSLTRLDFASGGLSPFFNDTATTEIVFVLYGTLDVGFITSANQLFSKTITQGDTFVFPRSLVHFLKNSGDDPASVIAAFNSQLPGTQILALSLFAASPEVPDNILAQTFTISTEEVQQIKSRFAP